MRQLFAAKTPRELVGAEMQHGGTAVGAGLRRLASLELVNQVSHLFRRQRLAGAHGSMAGQRRRDSPSRVRRRVFARYELQQLDESTRRVLATQSCRRCAQQVATAAKRLDLEAMLSQLGCV